MNKTINITTPKEDTLRGTGIGKLGWTEGGRLHSIKKRLLSTFDKDRFPSSKDNKIVVICPTCKKKFRTNNGKIPEHKGRWHSHYGNPNRMCSQNRSLFELTIKEYLKETIINEYTISIGDKVMFVPYPWSLFGGDYRDILEKEVEKIYLMSNDSTYLKFKDFEQLVPAYIFYASKNFIKL